MFGLDGLANAAAALVKGASEIISNTWKWLLDHPRTAVAIILTILLSYGSWKAYRYVNNLKSEIVVLSADNKRLKTDNATLKDNLNVAVEVNGNLTRTISQFEIDAQKLRIIIENLRGHESSAKARLEALEARLAAMDEKDNGPVAPVLKEAIKAVEADRRERERLWLNPQ